MDHGRRIILLSLIALLSVTAGLAANDSARVPWIDVAPDSIAISPGSLRVPPQSGHSVAIDEPALFARLSKAPLERLGTRIQQGAMIELPRPEGGGERFWVEESPIMEAPAAARFPEIRTYRIVGVDDTSATGRLGWTSAGLHAIVLADGGSWFVDPVARGDVRHHVSYRTRDLSVDDSRRANCLFDTHSESEAAEASETIRTGSLGPVPDTTLRTFRLAQAANFEYTLFHSGPVPSVPSKAAAINNGIIPTINRVNAIYERELAVRMILVGDQEAIVWDTPADPYTNESGINMLAENQATLDALIGNPNYDIGHVFSTGGGGVAGLGVVCDTALINQKAWGVTGLPAPVGDGFDVDFVAHEMGHQFGGNHTFNGTSGSCDGNDNGPTAFEVGSGSTIMGYAGICTGQNTQPHSDAYFHAASLAEMNSFIRTPAPNSCSASSATGNSVPTVDAGNSFTIPARTPFELTATASDPDFDILTYTWEEYDLGPRNDGNSDNGSSPIFRSFAPTVSATRIFPRQPDLLANTTTYGELLPTTSRLMTFRVTVRDNHVGGGATTFDEMQLQVRAEAGPFLVTAPDGGEQWFVGETRQISWDPAGTETGSINATHVNIFLSTDGGLSFPILLAAGVPNDGAQSIVVPGSPTDTARVKVKGAGSVFFDISNGPFAILPNSGPPVALDDEAVTPHNRPVVIDVLANDSDPDGQPLAIIFAESPTQAGGSVQVLNNGTPADTGDDLLRYLPAAGFDGVDSFEYVIDDGATSAAAFVTVRVHPVCPAQPTGIALEDFETGAPGWTVETPINQAAFSPPWTLQPDPGAQSPANSFSSDASGTDIKDDRLTSPTFEPSSSSTLVFWHRFSFESGFDGGVLEVSTDDGTSWDDILDAGGTFTEGGYNDTLSTDYENPLLGRPAWSDTSTPGPMARVEVDLGAFDGEQIRLRWRLGLDNGSLTTGVAWSVDDVTLTGLYEPPEVCPAPGAPGVVSTPLLVGRDGDELTLDWGAGCGAGAEDYGVHVGTIGNWYAHSSATCTTAGATTATLPIDQSNRYILIVSQSVIDEGSYGLDGAGNERPRSLAVCLAGSDTAVCP